MINLIPTRAKRQIKIEYAARVVVVGATALTFILVVANVLLVPQMVLLRSQHSALSDQYQTSVDTKQAIDDYIEQIKSTNATITMVHEAVTTESVVPYVQHIQSYESAAVTFDYVTVGRADGQVSTIEVAGLASTRNDLAVLKNQLLEDPAIAEVNLPLENLAKDKDLPFHITIKLAASENNS